MLFSPFAAPDAAGPALGAWVQHPRLLSPSAALRLFLSLFKIGLLVKITGNLRSSLFKAKLRAVLPGSQQLLYLPVFCSPRQSPGRLGVPRSGRLRDSRFLFCCWVFFLGGAGGVRMERVGPTDSPPPPISLRAQGACIPPGLPQPPHGFSSAANVPWGTQMEVRAGRGPGCPGPIPRLRYAPAAGGRGTGRAGPRRAAATGTRGPAPVPGRPMAVGGAGPALGQCARAARGRGWGCGARSGRARPLALR